jgi:hypothetical protein
MVNLVTLPLERSCFNILSLLLLLLCFLGSYSVKTMHIIVLGFPTPTRCPISLKPTNLPSLIGEPLISSHPIMINVTDVYSAITTDAWKAETGLSSSSSIRVAYDISVTSCPSVNTTPTAVVDGPAVQAYSIQKLPSRYAHDLVSILHPNATSCVDHLPKFGYKIIVKESGFELWEIKNKWSYLEYIKYQGCCEEFEFITRGGCHTNSSHGKQTLPVVLPSYEKIPFNVSVPCTPDHGHHVDLLPSWPTIVNTAERIKYSCIRNPLSKEVSKIYHEVCIHRLHPSPFSSVSFPSWCGSFTHSILWSCTCSGNQFALPRFDSLTH